MLAAAFVAGCGGSDGSQAASTTSTATATTSTTAVEEPASVGGLVATLGTNRLYSPNRGFGLGVQNIGDEPVVIREFRLDSGLFAPEPMTPREVVLRPGGRRLVLAVPYGGAVCDDDAETTFGAVIVLDDGQELRVPAVEDYPGAIGRVHSRECAAAEVHERVDITFGDEWTRDDVAITGDLILEQREPGAPVAIDDAVGNVIFRLAFEEEGHPVLRVTHDAPTARAQITISADRCDAHAVAEFKRPFVFLSWITIGDERPVPVELEPTGPARAALEDLLGTCL
jgi:hypothetical protein